MKAYQKQLDKEILKKELFRFLKEKGAERNSGISIVQAFKCSIALWSRKSKEAGNTAFASSPMQFFDFALARALNNCTGRVGCDIINNAFNWSTSAHEYALDMNLWPSLDTEWNGKNLRRWYK